MFRKKKPLTQGDLDGEMMDADSVELLMQRVRRSNKSTLLGSGIWLALSVFGIYLSYADSYGAFLEILIFMLAIDIAVIIAGIKDLMRVRKVQNRAFTYRRTELVHKYVQKGHGVSHHLVLDEERRETLFVFYEEYEAAVIGNPYYLVYIPRSRSGKKVSKFCVPADADTFTR